MKLAYAGNQTVNIHINITGLHDNTDYLCLPNEGCFNLTASDHGKTFKFMSGVDLNQFYITDISTRRLYNEGAPKSCQTTLSPGESVTITGHLDANNQIRNLNCVVHQA